MRWKLKLYKTPVDKAGNIWLEWNPGRYDGYTVLHPTREGFTTYATLPAPGDYDTWTYYSWLTDGNGDGALDVKLPVTQDCYTCGGGYEIVGYDIYYWDGDGFAQR